MRSKVFVIQRGHLQFVRRLLLPDPCLALTLWIDQERKTSGGRDNQAVLSGQFIVG